MAVRDEGVVQLLHRERDAQIFGVSVSDVVNQTLKEPV